MKIENLKVLALKKDDSNVRGHTIICKEYENN